MEIVENWQNIDLSSPKNLRRLDQIISLATGGSGNCVNCFYTTDLNQALDLLDSVDDDYTPRLVRLLLPLGGKVLHGWKCAIMPNVGDGADYEAIEDTPALAICKAWLSYHEAVAPQQAPASDGDAV